MTHWHLPDNGDDKNPYGRMMITSLERLGVDVRRIPYRHLLCLDALKEKPDVIHFQFIDPYILPAYRSRETCRALFKGPLFLVQVLILRLCGCRIVWTIHNLGNHDKRRPNVEWFYSLLFCRLAHALITHGKSAQEAVVRRYRLTRQSHRLHVVHHPNYIDAYPNTISQKEARTRLGIEPSRLLFLFFGQIRPYKGLMELIDAFRDLQPIDADLWVAGEATEQGLADELTRADANIHSLHCTLKRIPDLDVQIYMNACDVVVLPYRRILTSGAALLAMSFGRVCVAPRLGCLTELLDQHGAFLYDPADPAGLRNALSNAAEARAELSGMGQYNRRRAAEYSWPRAADTYLEIYRNT